MKINFKSLIINTCIGKIEVPCSFERIEHQGVVREHDAFLRYSVKGMWDESPREFTIEFESAIENDYKFLKKQLEERIAKKPQLPSDYYGDFVLKGAIISGDTIQLHWGIEEQGWHLDEKEYSLRICIGHIYKIESTERFARKDYNFMVFSPIVHDIYW